MDHRLAVDRSSARSIGRPSGATRPDTVAGAERGSGREGDGPVGLAIPRLLCDLLHPNASQFRRLQAVVLREELLLVEQGHHLVDEIPLLVRQVGQALLDRVEPGPLRGPILTASAAAPSRSSRTAVRPAARPAA